jgi:hypothetical protein
MMQIFSGEYYAPRYNTAAIFAGKGSGKSYFTGIANSYLYYWINSFKSFKAYLATKGSSFDDSATITIVGMAQHSRQAKEIVFDYTAKFINQVKAFYDRGWLPDPSIKSELQYTYTDAKTGAKFKKLCIIPGNSSESFALGYNLFAAIIDEAAFWKEKLRDPVEAIYNELENRRRTRFADNGIIILISSANVDGDFVEQFESKALTDPSIYFTRHSTYDCKPEYFSMPRFEFKTKRERADGTIQEVILHPPEAWKIHYETNPDRALKDYDAISSVAGRPFYADFMLLMSKINKDRTDPCPDLGLDQAESPDDIARRLPEEFKGIPGASYRVHIDLAKGNMFKGQCGCGFAMTHKQADPAFGYKIFLDLAVRFKAPSNKEIQIPEVLSLLKHLKEVRGFNIDLVTFDQWNSLQAIQTINGWPGWRAEELSVDRKEHVYLKNLIYSGQFDFYNDKNLLFELKRLEDFDTTIEHAINAFKDEADAVAGACFNAAALSATKDNGKVKEEMKPRCMHIVSIPRMNSDRPGGQIYRRDGRQNFKYREEF